MSGPTDKSPAQLLTSDVTALRQAQEHTVRLNSVLRAIRNVNQLITKEKDRERLLAGACRHLVEARGFHGAWVVAFDENRCVRACAEAELGDAFVPVRERIERGELPRCCEGALASPGAITVADVGEVCAGCSLARRHHPAAVACRLAHDGVARGVLYVTLPHGHQADPEERSLIEEVAGDLGFALHALEVEEAERRGRQELEEHRDKLEQLVAERTEELRNLLETVRLKEHALNSSLSPITISDLDGRLTYVNRAFLDAWGFGRPNEVLGRSVRDFSLNAPGSAEMVRILEKLGQASGEEIGRRKDGSTFPVRTTATLVKDEAGTAVGLMASFLDLTDEKRMLEALHLKELALGACLSPIAIADLDGRLTYVNRALLDTWGFASEEQALSHRLSDLWSAAEDAAPVLATVKSQGQWVGELTGRHATREEGLSVQVAASVVRGGDGAPISIMAAFFDLTARKKAAEQHTFLFERAPDGISVSVDFPPRFLDVNDAYCRMLGYTREELLDQPIMGKVDVGTTPEQAESVRQRFERDGHVTVETSFRRKDGRVIPVELSIARPSLERQITFARDIGERRDMQEKLRRADRLSTLGQLAAGVGHELRNPLAAIKNAAFLLKMAVEAPDPDVGEALQILETEVESSRRIIDSLLGFARPRRPEKRKLDVNVAVRDSVSRFKVPPSVEMVTRLDDAIPLVFADADQLGRVLDNLMRNAVQAMRDGGRLVIETALSPAGCVELSCEDTGVGIAEENLERIFEPLFTTKAKGIGLGLAISRTMIEEHGGRLAVESRPGKGSRFTIRLPLGTHTATGSAQGSTEPWRR